MDGGANVDQEEEDGMTPLHVAAMFGKKAVVQLLLDRGADPNKTDRERLTPLHWAVWKGWEEVAQILLDAGADPSQAEEIKETLIDSQTWLRRWWGLRSSRESRWTEFM